MKNIPKTLKSYEADMYIMPTSPCREIFKIIFNRFLRQVYNNISDIKKTVDINNEYLVKCTKINRKTVMKYRQELCDIGLIKVKRGKVELCLEYYLSLVFLYASIKEEDRESFSKAIAGNDQNELAKIGYKEISSQEIEEMLVILLYSKIPDTYVPKLGPNYEDNKLSPKIGTYENESYVPKMGLKKELCPKIGTYKPSDNAKSQNWDLTKELLKSYVPKLGLNSENCYEILQKLVHEIGVRSQNWDLSENEHHSKKDNDAENQAGALIILEILSSMLSKSKSYVPKMGLKGQKLSPNFTHRIKNNIYTKKYTDERSEYVKEKNKKENSEELLGETSSPESFLNFSETFSEQDELPVEKEEEVEDRLGIIQLKPEKEFGKDSVKLSQLERKNFKLENPYKNKPYYSQEDFKKITAPFEDGETVQSPVRLFFYIFWGSLWEYYKSSYIPEGETDEYGNEQEDDNFQEDDLSMVGALVPEKDIQAIIESSYQDLLGAIEKGCYEDEYTKVKIGFKDFKDFQPEFMFDWKSTALQDFKNHFVVSLDGVRNIEGEDTDLLPTPRTKDEIKNERRNSHRMIRAIMREDDTNLTPVELSAKMFLQEFGVFDDSFHMNGFRSSRPMMVDGGEEITSTVETNELSRQMYLREASDICGKAGIPLPEFFGVLTASRNGEAPERIVSREAVFSYTKVTNLNRKNHWESVIQV